MTVYTMNNQRREWTQNEDEVLKRLGPQVSRNAVAGRASRLQIRSSNPQGFASDGANPARRKQAAPTIRRFEKYAAHKTVEGDEFIKEVAVMETELIPVTSDEGNTVEGRMVGPIVTTAGKEGVPFMEARSFHCRTVIGSDIGADEISLARFCGKQVRKPGESFCPQCRSRFYYKPARR
jgi:hypothetical protein